jgi:hypothetical protein
MRRRSEASIPPLDCKALWCIHTCILHGVTLWNRVGGTHVDWCHPSCINVWKDPSLLVRFNNNYLLATNELDCREHACPCPNILSAQVATLASYE